MENWTINEAKQGDILRLGKQIFIFDHIKNEYVYSQGFIWYNDKDDKSFHLLDNTVPYASIAGLYNQTNYIEKGSLRYIMSEAGYELDAVSHMVKRIPNSLHMLARQEALKIYPLSEAEACETGEEFSPNKEYRMRYAEGYEKGSNDMIEKALSWLKTYVTQYVYLDHDFQDDPQKIILSEEYFEESFRAAMNTF